MLWPGWDRSVFFAVNGIDSRFLTLVMRVLTDVDNWIPFLLAGVAVLLWMGRTRPNSIEGGRWKRAFAKRNPRVVVLCLILAVAASDQTSYHIKRWTGRPRPCFDETTADIVEYRGEVYGNRSFPSAHAANSAALATVTSLAYPPLAPFAALVAFLVGFSRVYLGVHYPLDVLTGWGIGAAAGLLIWTIFRGMASRQGIIGFTNRFRYRQPAPGLTPGRPWEPVEFHSLDGYLIRGYLRGGGSRLAVVVHGLHEDIVAMVRPGDILAGMGFSVLLVPLRGHDGHPVPVTSGGPAEACDIAGALLHAELVLGYERDRTVIYGSSMGGAASIKVAGLLGHGVAGVIAHGSYADFFRSAEGRLGKAGTFFLKLFLPAGVRNGLESFRPEEYPGPWQKTRFAYITGEQDRICSPEASEELAGKTGGIVIKLRGEGHPVWKRSRSGEPRITAALERALEYIDGDCPSDRLIDGTVKLFDRSASKECYNRKR
ncbi:MAG: phosphatase PAP2 family protein [Candidatus Aegiribacteria sp.]